MPITKDRTRMVGEVSGATAATTQVTTSTMRIRTVIAL